MLQKVPEVLKFLPVAAGVVGALLILLFAMRHMPEMLKSASLKVDHPTAYRFTVYDGLLKKYVNQDGFVDYKSLSKDKDLNKAVDELETISADKMTDQKERLCFWLNAVNLLAIKAVCDHYPVKTVQQISDSFSEQKLIVGGKTYSWQQIEDMKVLPEMKDSKIRPEVVFLLCRASQYYPPLTNHAITPETMEDDAKIAAYKFINDPKNVYYDGETLTFYLSPWFKRFEPILSRNGKSPHEFVLLYLVTESPINVEALMLTKTYFPQTNYLINDTALAPRKEKE